MSLMFPLIPLYLALYLLYWRRAPTLSLSEPQHCLGLLTLLVFSVQWREALQHQTAEKVFTETLAIIAAFWLFQHLQLHRTKVEDEIRIARSRLPVAPGLALPFFQVIEGIVDGRPHSDYKRWAASAVCLVELHIF